MDFILYFVLALTVNKANHSFFEDAVCLINVAASTVEWIAIERFVYLNCFTMSDFKTKHFSRRTLNNG